MPPVLNMLGTLSESKRGLVDQLKLQGPLTIEELSAQTHLAETTVRQHLGDLLDAGLITREAISRGRGRPRYRYALTQAGAALYPSSEGTLLEELLNRLLEVGQQALVTDFFEGVWAKRAAEVSRRLAAAGDDGFETRLRVLQDVLEEEGFMPAIEREGGRIRVCERHCPLRQAVEATPVPCRLEAEFVQHALGRKTRRVSYIPAGGKACEYDVEPE